MTRPPAMSAAGNLGRHRALDVFTYQVGVHGDRGRRTATRRGDDLEARIHHVARGPDAGCAGLPAGVDRDETGAVNFAAQRAQQIGAIGSIKLARRASSPSPTV